MADQNDLVDIFIHQGFLYLIIRDQKCPCLVGEAALNQIQDKICYKTVAEA